MTESFDQVTRLEIIDHTPCKTCAGQGRVNVAGMEKSIECPYCGGGGFPGREVIFWQPDKQIELSLQDDQRTLKIFISQRPK